MANSKVAIKMVLEYEGVYDNDPKDSGGETVFGITRVYQPKWEGWKRVDEIKTSGIGPLVGILSKDPEVSQCVNAYYDSLWNSLFLTQIQSEALASCIFNGVVNQGPGRTIKWLQYCVNAVSKNTSDVSEDGVMGVGTINQISALENEGKAALLTDLLKAQRIAAYTVTCHKREDSLKYIQGWLNRINRGG